MHTNLMKIAVYVHFANGQKLYNIGYILLFK